MFYDGISKLLIFFVLYSFWCDLKFTLNMKKNSKYNKFELAAGSYVDIAFLSTIILLILGFLGFNTSSKCFIIVVNLILALIYCGLFKVVLQKLIRSKYFWVDTKEEEKDIRKMNRKRTVLLIDYTIFTFVLRNLALTLYKGLNQNYIAIAVILFLAVKISKNCSRINHKIKREEEKENRKLSNS